MSDGIRGDHFTDKEGNPTGGITSGIGWAIQWQNGPLMVDGVRKERNGAFVEEIIEAAVDRLRYYQSGKFRSVHNDGALVHLAAALRHLRLRTADRERRGVEGSHEV